MAFYDLPKAERTKLALKIRQEIASDLEAGKLDNIKRYASDDDTYIRKNAYLALGKLYHERQSLQDKIFSVLTKLFIDKDEKIRQTAVYAFGEIGKMEAEKVLGFFEAALNDEHRSVRNAVVGSLKQMGQANPKPTIKFAKKSLRHPDPLVRQAIIHGIELRGRTHPADILPLLAELQNDPDSRVRKRLVHVLSQISYKRGCLEKVVAELKRWENKKLVERAIEEILDVHKRYKNFSAKSYEEAKEYIKSHLQRNHLGI